MTSRSRKAVHPPPAARLRAARQFLLRGGGMQPLAGRRGGTDGPVTPTGAVVQVEPDFSAGIPAPLSAATGNAATSNQLVRLVAPLPARPHSRYTPPAMLPHSRHCTPITLQHSRHAPPPYYGPRCRLHHLTVVCCLLRAAARPCTPPLPHRRHTHVFHMHVRACRTCCACLPPPTPHPPTRWPSWADTVAGRLGGGAGHIATQRHALWHCTISPITSCHIVPQKMFDLTRRKPIGLRLVRSSD